MVPVLSDPQTVSETSTTTFAQALVASVLGLVEGPLCEWLLQQKACKTSKGMPGPAEGHKGFTAAVCAQAS